LIAVTRFLAKVILDDVPTYSDIERFERLLLQRLRSLRKEQNRYRHLFRRHIAGHLHQTRVIPHAAVERHQRVNAGVARGGKQI
jgi:hypothetical protein